MSNRKIWGWLNGCHYLQQKKTKHKKKTSKRLSHHTVTFFLREPISRMWFWMKLMHKVFQYFYTERERERTKWKKVLHFLDTGVYQPHLLSLESAKYPSTFNILLCSLFSFSFPLSLPVSYIHNSFLAHPQCLQSSSTVWLHIQLALSAPSQTVTIVRIYIHSSCAESADDGNGVILV